MSRRLSYLMIGRGRWASRICSILSAEARSVEILDSSVRSRECESELDYLCRMRKVFGGTHADIAWMALPPGKHIPLLVESAISSGMHVVVEKPWIYSREISRRLQHLANNLRRFVSVNFEYCFLDSLSRWRQHNDAGRDVYFGGTFHITTYDRLNIAANINLGQHLLAIQEYLLPKSSLIALDCRYDADSPDRRVWIQDADRKLDEIDFTRNSEPIIQRYISHVEGVLAAPDNCFNLEFASRVHERQLALVDV